MKILKGNSKRVIDLAFSTDGRMLVSAGIDKTVRVSDTHTGTGDIAVPPKGRSSEWAQVSFCAGDTQILCRSRNGLEVWDVAGKNRVAKLLSDRSFQTGLAVSQVRGIAVTNEWISRPFACAIRAWDTRTWKDRVFYRTRENYHLPALAFDPTGTRLATRVGIFDVDTGTRLVEAILPGDSMQWSPTAPSWRAPDSTPSSGSFTPRRVPW